MKGMKMMKRGYLLYSRFIFLWNLFVQAGTHARKGQSHHPAAVFFCSCPLGAIAKKRALFLWVFILNSGQAKKAGGIFLKFKTRSAAGVQEIVFYKKGGGGQSRF